MPGWLTNGLPLIEAPTQNGVSTDTNPGTPGTYGANQSGVYSNLSASAALLPVDTESASGQTPQTVAATPFQIGSAVAALIENTATSTVHAATLNTTAGMIVTEALTTAAGATYTFTLTNSLITSTSPAPQVQIHDGTNTAGGEAVTSITNGSGSSTFVFTNTGTAAWNGTKLITFHV